MICPKCGSEYRQGMRECAKCGVPLVDERTSAAPDQRLLNAGGQLGEDVELVTVFRSWDVSVIGIAESILRSAQVDFMTRGRDIQGLFGWGGFPAGTSLAMGPMEILCRRQDAADAMRMLENLASGDDEFEIDDSFDVDGEE